MSESSAYAQAFAQSIGAQQAFKVAIVAPVHIQPSEMWIKALNYAAKTATIIIVDDSDGVVKLPENWDVYDYARQREELGDDMYAQFEMFHKSASCKTFGVWLAHKRGFDPIIVIDSDCVIPPDFVAKHIEALLRFGDGWDNPLKGTGWYSRGFPYHERQKQTWAHMGLWENELDLYGTDRIGRTPPRTPPQVDYVSNGAHFPLSGMNVSFRNEAAPFMMFLPNFEYEDQKFTRHDDIWGGYLFQKIARAKGYALSYGNPIVFHDTIVIPEEDAAEERAMIKYEKAFYQMIDEALTHTLWWGNPIDPVDVYEDIISHLRRNESAFGGLIPAFAFAADMFAENNSYGKN